MYKIVTFDFIHQAPYLTLCKLADEYNQAAISGKGGDGAPFGAFQLKFGGVSCVVLTDPKVIRQCFSESRVNDYQKY